MSAEDISLANLIISKQKIKTEIRIKKLELKKLLQTNLKLSFAKVLADLKNQTQQQVDSFKNATAKVKAMLPKTAQRPDVQSTKQRVAKQHMIVGKIVTQTLNDDIQAQKATLLQLNQVQSSLPQR